MDRNNGGDMTSPKSVLRAKLAACEERIVQLEAQLAAERKLRDKVLTEAQSTLAISSISALPTETLMQIFDGVVEDDSLAIRSVLFICRRWYRVAIDHSTLWASICLRLPEEKIVLYLRAATEYAKKALERSGQSLLDITLDFRNMVNFDTTAFVEASSPFPKGPASIIRYAWQLHGSLRGEETCVLTEATQSLYLGLLIALMDDGAAAHRWRTLVFKTYAPLSQYTEDDSYDLSTYLFARHGMLALERVDLLDYHEESMESLPRARHVLILSQPLYDIIEQGSDTLEVLHTILDSGLVDLTVATKLRHLALDLTCDLYPPYVPQMTLNSLETLTIRGTCEGVLHRLNTPALRLLRLVGKEAILSAPSAPCHLKVAELHILAAESDDTVVHDVIRVGGFQRFAASTIAVMPWHLDALTEWLRERKGASLVCAECTVRTVEWSTRHTSVVAEWEGAVWRTEERDLRCRTREIV